MKQFGLIGHPLNHSFSQNYFNKKFQLENINDCVFELFPIDHVAQIKDLIASNPMLVGLAVTIPYKESVIPFLTDLHEKAKAVKAVNCIKINANEWIGYNTDIIGFERSFIPLLKNHHTKALVLGTGGAAKAVAYVLENLGISVTFVSRFPQNQSGQLSYAQISPAIINEHTIIVNATPIGMTPQIEASPLNDYKGIGSQHYLFDLIYNPSETIFLQEGKKRGAIVKNGLEMLVIQAEENWKIWNDII